MTYLVDANVLSEATKPMPDIKVLQWLRENEREIVIDPVILGEVRFGIDLLPASAKRRQLEKWFSDGIERIQCLTWDAVVGLRWAKLIADLRAKGQNISVKDSFIAASALTHDLILATRNVRDFQKTGVKIRNPFE